MMPANRSRKHAYSNELRGWKHSAREARDLYSSHRTGAHHALKRRHEAILQMEKELVTRYGLKSSGLDVLDIGCGPRPFELTYLSRDARAVGADLEVIAHGWHPRQYIHMFSENGARRTLKTIARKSLGVDRSFWRDVQRLIGPVDWPKIAEMNALNLTHESGRFDLVHSRALYHHFPDPLLALTEVDRVLKPGGVAWIEVHPFTSQTAGLDPRFYPELNPEAPRWPQLRPQHASEVHSNTWINGFRVEDWRRTGKHLSPTADLMTFPAHDADRQIEEAKALRSSGELTEYSIEELTAGRSVITWQKQEGNEADTMLKNSAATR